MESKLEKLETILSYKKNYTGKEKSRKNNKTT